MPDVMTVQNCPRETAVGRGLQVTVSRTDSTPCISEPDPGFGSGAAELKTSPGLRRRTLSPRGIAGRRRRPGRLAAPRGRGPVRRCERIQQSRRADGSGS